MVIYTIGDIHNNYDEIVEVLTASNFDYDNDKLICLGDIVDGGTQTFEVVEELLKIKNLIFIRGNHDNFFMKHLSTGWDEEIWIQQGGANTLRSYGAKVIEGEGWDDRSKLNLTDFLVPVTHQDLFNKSVLYHIENNMLFVHGGWDFTKVAEHQKPYTLMWDRTIIDRFKNGKLTTFNKIFIGHTTTQQYNTLKPIKYGKLIMMDTGAGWNGKLTIMNIDTEEYWQSKKQIGGR